MSVDTKASDFERVIIDGHVVEYRLRAVRDGSLRVRVGPRGVQVLHPVTRSPEDVQSFLRNNAGWLLEQLDRVARLRSLRMVRQRPAGEILLHGIPTQISVEDVARRELSNKVRVEAGRVVLVLGRRSRTPPATTLENWLRREARARISPLVDTVASKLGVAPGRLYIMDQRTKWGNCSALGNLSFNWRIVMAPDSVVSYLVTHEVVHLAVPDHSHRFWLTVQSHCPETERARQWLVANGHRLLVDLKDVIASGSRPA